MAKRLINGTEHLNNLAPIKYQWAYKMFQNSLSNHWTPHEIPVSIDKFHFETKLTDYERHLFYTTFATLTSADTAILKNLAVNVFERLTAPEVQLYVARQIAEEAIHSVSYQYIIEHLGLDEDKIYSLYETVPEIKQKFDLARAYAERFDDDLIAGLIFYYCCWEGIWFMGGFNPILSLNRRGLMPGAVGQLIYIMRDESMHTAFGIKLIKEICAEEKIILDSDKVRSIINDAVEAEIIFSGYTIKDVIGYNKEIHMGHIKHLANKRLASLGLPSLYKDAVMIPWVSEMSGINKERNFFETRVTEYQVGSVLTFDDNTSINEISNWRK